MPPRKVEIAGEGDHAGVLSLLRDSFGSKQRISAGAFSKEFWDWKFENSPYGRAIVQVIKSRGEVIATGSLWPFSFAHGGEIVRAFETCNVAVDANFRRQGLFTTLLDARVELARARGANFLFSFPNNQSLPGYLKSGWQFVGRVPWLIRVRHPFAVLLSRLHNAKTVAIPIPDSFQLTDSLIEGLEESGNGLESGISLDRPDGYWNWRFRQRPGREYGVIRSRSGTSSRAIFTLGEKPAGLIEMVVVDLVADQEGLQELMPAIIAAADDVGASFIALMKPKALATISFYRRGFIRMHEKNLVFLPLDPDLPQAIGQIGYWDFRASMHDSI